MLLGLRHVEFNGIHLPVESAVQQARRTCLPLHALDHGIDRAVYNRGSAFLYLYRGRQFCVFTRHQMSNDKTPSQVCLRLTADDRKLNSRARFVRFPDIANEAREEFDLCALEMPWLIESHSNAPTYYRARPSESISLDRLGQFFAMGYPYKLTTSVLDEASETYKPLSIHMSQVAVWADVLTSKPNDLLMLKLRPGIVMGPECRGDFDGFSGGPVFEVNRRSLAVEFLGITIRGGGDKLFFAHSAWVDALCDRAFNYVPIKLVAA